MRKKRIHPSFGCLQMPAWLGRLLFIGAILAGYIYAWKKGALEWER